MTRARDVANVLSTATSLATDTETAAAISSHNTAANGHVGRGNTAGRPASPTAGDTYANTETGFIEVYTGATYGWEQVGVISSTVTGVTATNSGSGRGYNNGSASVSFTPGAILGRSYTVTSSPGGYTATGSSSPITVTGLQSGTQYTYTVTSTNSYGTSAASAASAGVTATTVPQAPILSVASSHQSATVTITPGETGGSDITEYTITSNPATTTQTTSNTTYTFTGLTNGISYTFTATATNANGTSSFSAASNSVTPASVVKASGGTITSDDSYYYHTFTGSGTFAPTQSITADILVIAGGGSGGNVYYAGGGGAGGLVLHSSQSLTNQNYTVTVGAGASRVPAGSYSGLQGGNSQFGSLSASIGGGRGRTNEVSGQGGNAIGGSGGSGGGGGADGNGGGAGAGGAGTPGQGNNGGSAASPGGSNSAGGGGGGAGAAGGSAGSNTGGQGGSGTSSYSSWGLATSTGQNINGTFWYAGGGGGGAGNGAGGQGGNGGNGGGGKGINALGTAGEFYNGSINTGGGGGGATNGQLGSLGGSGIVIVRYTR